MTLQDILIILFYKNIFTSWDKDFTSHTYTSFCTIFGCLYFPSLKFELSNVHFLRVQRRIVYLSRKRILEIRPRIYFLWYLSLYLLHCLDQSEHSILNGSGHRKRLCSFSSVLWTRISYSVRYLRIYDL